MSAVSLQPVAAPDPGAGGRSVVRSVLVRAAALAVVGVAVGLLWAAVTPSVRAASEGIERDIAGELTFAGLAVLAGVVVAVAGLVRPGPRPVVGVLAGLLGSGVASVIAWGVGRAAGAPVLAAVGVVLLWPLATALVTAVVTLVLVLVNPESSAKRG